MTKYVYSVTEFRLEVDPDVDLVYRERRNLMRIYEDYSQAALYAKQLMDSEERRVSHFIKKEDIDRELDRKLTYRSLTEKLNIVYVLQVKPEILY